jgi:hypothetical protein
MELPACSNWLRRNAYIPQQQQQRRQQQREQISFMNISIKTSLARMARPAWKAKQDRAGDDGGRTSKNASYRTLDN